MHCIYHQPIETGVFPSSLRLLYICRRFIQRSVAGVLSGRLKQLIVEEGYSQPLKTIVLPSTLKTLFRA
jgi:hypothetical protein